MISKLKEPWRSKYIQFKIDHPKLRGGWNKWLSTEDGRLHRREMLANKSQEEKDESIRKHRKTLKNKPQKEKEEINQRRSETLKNKSQEGKDKHSRKISAGHENKPQEEKDIVSEKSRKQRQRELKNQGHGGMSADRWENVQQWFFKLARDLKAFGFGESYFGYNENKLGEKSITGYWVDFYNKKAGLVIEADRPKDRGKFELNGYLTAKAKRRQSRIEERFAELGYPLNHFLRWYKGEDLEKREQEILELVRKDVMVSA